MIREFEDIDLDCVMNIWLQANIEAHNFIPSQYWIDNFEMVKNALPLSEVYVCEDEGAIKGFIGIDNGYIAGMFVLKPYQSQGIGRQLMAVSKEKYPVLKLSVYTRNRKAIDFYSKEGFIIHKEQTDDNTKEIEYLMEYTK